MEVAYAWRSYDTAQTGQTVRDDTRLDAQLQLKKDLGKYHRLLLQTVFTNNDSNHTANQYKRTQVSLTAEFHF